MAPSPECVVVVHVAPVVAPEQLVPAVFAAAVTAFGSRAICDVADGPHDSVLVHLSDVAVTGDSVRGALRAELAHRLNQAGATRRVDVEVLSAGGGPGAVVREIALQWIQRAGPDAFLSSRSNAYDTAIRQLLDSGQLGTAFQPLVEAWSGRVVGFEALYRGPKSHVLEMPDAFFDALARSALQREAHLHLIESARRRAAEVLPDKDLLLFINAPTEDHWPVRGDADVAMLSLDAWPWPRVVFEVTEKAPVRNKAVFAHVVEWGRNAGVRFALDDVGAGYAGLSTYSLVQPEFTKIDMGLIRGCDSDPTRRAIIASLVTLAHRTGSQVVAEGVETTAELETVRWLGVDLVQGYLIAPPSATPSTLHHPWLASTPRRRVER